MPFIGKQPKVGAYQLIDSITTSATATYALTVDGSAYFPASARNLIVSLNGVTQAPESAYTVSGSNIVFDSALTASDVIDYILVIGDAVDIGTPSDGTVGNAQLKSDLDFSGKTLTFSNDQISGNAIDGGTISNFASTGIDDNATSTAITIDSSQNVGIGTTSPTARFDTRISTTTGKVAEFHNTAGYGIDFTVEGNSGVNTISSGTTQALAFATNGSSNERMRIDSSGGLGIGTTNVDAGVKLHVQESDAGLVASTGTSVALFERAGNAGITIGCNGAGDTTVFFGKETNSTIGRVNYDHSNNYMSFWTNNNPRLYISNIGDVLVGATSQVSTETLGVTTSSGIVALFKANQPSSTAVHTAFYNSTGLAAKIDRAGLYTQVSDRSLKHDVSDSTLGLTEVLNIPVRSFKWNGSEDYVAAGFIAQELEQALPSAVSTDEDTGLKGRSDGNIVPVLVKAIQEQQAIIEDLQTRLSALEAN